MPRPRLLFLLLLVSFLAHLSGCARRRVCWGEHSPALPWTVLRDDSRGAELCAKARRLEKQDESSCVDAYYAAAMATLDQDRLVGVGCEDDDAATAHKYALERLIVTAQRFNRFDAQHGLLLCDGTTSFWLPVSYHGFPWNRSDFHFLVPVGDYKTKTFSKRYGQPGAGIPLVIVRCGKDDVRHLPEESAFPATFRLTAGRCELYDPLRVDCIREGGQPIAKEISASLAYRLKDVRDTILSEFVDPFTNEGDTRLVLAEPYQPGKVPVILIHGLLSDPYTWAEMVNELRATAGFSNRFQLWFFEYPTGRAFLESAAQLRRQLREVKLQYDPGGQDQATSNMVLIGHSMGGLIAKLQVTESGDRLWRSVANRPLEQIVTTPDLRADLFRLCYFRPSPFISRVIFIGTPHGGSAFARRMAGRLGSSLVRPPAEESAKHRSLVDANPGVFSEELTRRIPTSIDLMKPDSKLLCAIADLPVTARTQFHTILGDGCLTLGLERSDGVVTVERAREPRSVSELHVRARHARLNKESDSIKEVIRILSLSQAEGSSWVQRSASAKRLIRSTELR